MAWKRSSVRLRYSPLKSAFVDFLFVMDFFVYILHSSKCDKYYIGHTESIDNRLYEHTKSKGGKFSKTCAPWQLMYKEPYFTRSEAMKREKEIKAKKSRKYIEFFDQLKGPERPVIRREGHPDVSGSDILH